MKYSLRTLMIVVTLACVVLGGAMGRVEYLRRWAVYHDQMADKLCEGINVGLYPAGEEQAEATLAMVRHDRLTKQYERAVYRPWTIVDETQELALLSETP
jgi:hypothetical protein